MQTDGSQRPDGVSEVKIAARSSGTAVLRAADVAEGIPIGASGTAGGSPTKRVKGGVQKLLHAAFKQPLHRFQSDPNIALQGTRSSRVVCSMSKTQLQDGYVSYPWEKMKGKLPISNSSSYLSMLILPKAVDAAASSYNSFDDTLARANAWFNASQASGVPIEFVNVQTESLLTKISGEKASATVNTGSQSDLSNLANASLYGFEDYHGVDIGVVKAVRLWYTPAAGELAVEINLREGDARLGFAISRTEEGFIYISSVVNDDDKNETPSTRSGLRDLHREATYASQLLVISRVSGEKVLPWMVSSSGAIRCFDTISLSQKLSLHRHASQPILLHVLMWEQPSPSIRVTQYKASTPPSMSAALPPLAADELPGNMVPHDTSPTRLERDTAGEISFRFHDFSLPNNWV